MKNIVLLKAEAYLAWLDTPPIRGIAIETSGLKVLIGEVVEALNVGDVEEARICLSSIRHELFLAETNNQNSTAQ